MTLNNYDHHCCAWWDCDYCCCTAQSQSSQCSNAKLLTKQFKLGLLSTLNLMWNHRIKKKKFNYLLNFRIMNQTNKILIMQCHRPRLVTDKKIWFQGLSLLQIKCLLVGLTVSEKKNFQWQNWGWGCIRSETDNLTIMPTSCCDVLCVEVWKKVLNINPFLPSSLFQFSCVEPCTTTWMSSRRSCLKVCAVTHLHNWFCCDYNNMKRYNPWKEIREIVGCSVASLRRIWLLGYNFLQITDNCNWKNDKASL